MRRTFLAVLLLIPSGLLAQPDTADTRLLQSPAVSRDHIAFVYADDLWICDLDGRNVRRLTPRSRYQTIRRAGSGGDGLPWMFRQSKLGPLVENWPADLQAGRDPQLEKAIEIVLDELKKNPPAKPLRPPYPVRVKRAPR